MFIHIAVIVTCYNRCQLTLASLRALFNSINTYNLTNTDKQVAATVFLTDDACTDGTVETVLKKFPDENIQIINGTGNLFWAGGMRKAWKAAIDSPQNWDYFLLLNDDTFCKDDAMEELLSTQYHIKDKHGQEGIVSAVCESADGKKITYGAEYYSHPLIGKSLFMHPTGKPEPCYRINCNLVLVSHNVVEQIGIFDDDFKHSCADWAYGIKASRSGIPVYITSKVCAVCENNHDNVRQEADRVSSMSLEERKAFFSHPLHSTSDKLIFMKRYYIEKYIITYIMRLLAIYMPRLYYKLLLSRPQKQRK